MIVGLCINTLSFTVAQTEGEVGAKDNILTYKERNNGRMQKTV